MDEYTTSATPIVAWLYILVSFLLPIFKLTGVVNWNWLWVLSPCWIVGAFVSILWLILTLVWLIENK